MENLRNDDMVIMKENANTIKLYADVPEGQYEKERLQTLLKENQQLRNRIDNLCLKINEAQLSRNIEATDLLKEIEMRDKKISELENTISWLAPLAAAARNK